MSPRRLYRILATAEVLTWAFLLTAVALKRVTHTTDALVPPAGAIHGFIFLSYVLATVFVAVNDRWRTSVTAIGLLSSIIPFATIAFERWLEKRQQLSSVWRLASGGDQPRGAVEQAQALALRKPLAALLATAAALVVVFALLLAAGPPTQWFH